MYYKLQMNDLDGYQRRLVSLANELHQPFYQKIHKKKKISTINGEYLGYRSC